jgi:hypothetical protein
LQFGTDALVMVDCDGNASAAATFITMTTVSNTNISQLVTNFNVIV